MTNDLLKILEDYLKLLQLEDDEEEKIIQVKKMIWAVESDRKTRAFINNLTYGRRR